MPECAFRSAATWIPSTWQQPAASHFTIFVRDTLNTPMFRGSRNRLLAALLAAAIIPYFLNLGVSSIWDANEAFYAQTPREMMEAGDYITPSFNFQLRMNKPVLSYWNVAASYQLFGISEWSERLPIAIGAVAIIGT